MSGAECCSCRQASLDDGANAGETYEQRHHCSAEQVAPCWVTEQETDIARIQCPQYEPEDHGQSGENAGRCFGLGRHRVALRFQCGAFADYIGEILESLAQRAASLVL